MRDRTEDDVRQAILKELLELKPKQIGGPTSPVFALVKPIIDELERKPPGEINYESILKKIDGFLKKFGDKAAAEKAAKPNAPEPYTAITKNAHILNAKKMLEDHLQSQQQNPDNNNAPQPTRSSEKPKGQPLPDNINPYDRYVFPDPATMPTTGISSRSGAQQQDPANMQTNAIPDNVNLHQVYMPNRPQQQRPPSPQEQQPVRPRSPQGQKTARPPSPQDRQQPVRQPSPQDRQQAARPRSPNLFDKIGKGIDKIAKNILPSSPASDPDEGTKNHNKPTRK